MVKEGVMVRNLRAYELVAQGVRLRILVIPERNVVLADSALYQDISTVKAQNPYAYVIGIVQKLSEKYDIYDAPATLTEWIGSSVTYAWKGTVYEMLQVLHKQIHT